MGHQNPPWAYRRTIHFQEHQSTGTSSFTTSSSHSKNKRPTLFSKQIPSPPPRHQMKEEATTIESTSVTAAETAAAELGMTKDRQDDIQDKIGMLMLGKK